MNTSLSIPQPIGPVELSIVIVNYNTCDELGNCLHSIFFGNSNVCMEVWVVDNSSTDNSISMVSSSYPTVQIISNKTNQGFAAANNLVFPRANGTFLLLLNPDTILPRNCLRELLDFIRDNSKIGMIGPKLVRKNGKLDHACRRLFPTKIDIISRLFWLDRIFSKSKLLGHYSLSYQDADQAGPVDCISGAFMLVRQLAVDQVGLLDERTFLYGEDVDWAWRFHEAGWIVYYYPKVEVVHLKRAASIKNASFSIKQFYAASYQYYLKYYGDNNSRFFNFLIHVAFSTRKFIALCIWKLFRRWI